MTQLLINETLLEIDHIFVCLGAAPNKLSLEKIGLICGEKVSYHPQQGTASSLICFENTYIELIWVEDQIKAEIYAMRSGIDFIARSYSPTKATSPFGIALHQKPNIVHRESNNSLNNLIDQSSQSPEQFINFAAANLALETEPLCFMIPEQISFLSIFNPLLKDHQKLIDHPLGIKKLTNTRIFMITGGNLTNPVSMLKREGIIEIEQNYFPLLELTFDYGSRMTSVDLQSIGIPIVLKY